MSCHQSYLPAYLNLHHRLLHSAGPLSPPVRQLVAVLASASLACCPLVELHRQTDHLQGRLSQALQTQLREHKPSY